MTKKMLKLGAQAIVNSYEGAHGKPVSIYDSTEKRVVKHIQFYLSTIGTTGILCIRGSDESGDWKQNLDTHSIDIMDGRMHLGTFEDHRRIMYFVAEWARNFHDIIIFGHSKGAMSALAEYLFLKERFHDKNIKCAAYAPAKTFSRKMRKFFPEEDVVTIINGEDFVTKQPFWKFCHVGRILHIGKKNIFMKIPIIRALGVFDHYPEKYLANIQNI